MPLTQRVSPTEVGPSLLSFKKERKSPLLKVYTKSHIARVTFVLSTEEEGGFDSNVLGRPCRVLPEVIIVMILRPMFERLLS